MDPRDRRKTKVLTVMLLAVMVVCFFVPVDKGAISSSLYSPIYTKVTYAFFHGNLLHLLLNGYCLYALVYLCRVVTPRYLLVALLIGFVSGFASPAPAIGFSGVLYALYGLYRYRFNVRFRRIIAFSLVLPFLIAFVAPVKIAWGIHLAAYLGGIAAHKIISATTRWN